MFTRQVKADSTDVSVVLRVIDSADGTPETSVDHATTGIDLKYRREGAANVDITEAALAALTTAHTDGGVEQIGNGYIRVDVPDAAFAAGVPGVLIHGTITDMIVIGCYVELPVNTPTDVYTRVGAPAGASIAADLVVIDNFVDDLEGRLTSTRAGYLDNLSAGAVATAAALDTVDNFLDTEVAAILAAVDTEVAAILLAVGTDGVVVATASKTGYRLSSAGVDDVWDEATSGHVGAGSFGATLPIIRSNTAQNATSTTIVLDASASAADDFYNNQHIFILSGTGAGQGRFISDYTGSSKTVSVSAWVTTPDVTSVFVITPFGSIPGATAPTASEVADAVWDEVLSGHIAVGSAGQVLFPVRANTAQAGTTSSVTLDASASATDNLYRYRGIRIIAGTGAGQASQITAYVGATKVATVSPAFIVAPSSDSVFVIDGLGIDAIVPAALVDLIWDEARSGHVGAGTFGEYVLADVTRISGNGTPADALEAILTGGGGTITADIDGVLSEVTTLTGHTAQTGDSFALLDTGGNIANAIAAVKADTAAILVDTADIQPKIGAPAGASVSADIAAVKAETASIQTDTNDIQTRIPAALNNGVMAADVQRINNVEIIGDGDATPFDVA